MTVHKPHISKLFQRHLIFLILPNISIYQSIPTLKHCSSLCSFEMLKQKTKRLFSLYVSARNSICNDRDLLCSACSVGTFAPLYVCLFSCLAVSEESQCWWWWAIYLASIMKNARHLRNLWMLGKHSLTTRQSEEPAGMVVTRNRMGTVEPASISLLELEATAPKSFAICNHWSVNRRFSVLQNKTNFMGKSSLLMVAVAAEEERTTSWKKFEQNEKSIIIMMMMMMNPFAAEQKTAEHETHKYLYKMWIKGQALSVFCMYVIWESEVSTQFTDRRDYTGL